MTKIFYKDAKIILFVYDITYKKSFDELKNYWISQVQEHCNSDVLLGIVANKNDLYINQQVTKEEGLELAEKIGAIYQITSAKSGFGINNLFENIGRKYIDPKFDYQEADRIAEENYNKKKKELEEAKKKKEKRRGVKLDVQNNKKKEKCC